VLEIVPDLDDVALGLLGVDRMIAAIVLDGAGPAREHLEPEAARV